VIVEILQVATLPNVTGLAAYARILNATVPTRYTLAKQQNCPKKPDHFGLRLGDVDWLRGASLRNPHDGAFAALKAVLRCKREDRNRSEVRAVDLHGQRGG